MKKSTVTRKRWRRLAVAFFSLAAIVAVGSFVCVGLLTQPNQESIPLPPSRLHAEAVSFPSASGATIRGWLSKGERGRGAILLLHGVHANRMAMLDRAEFFADAGYTVLLIDFQAHGESIGRAITFGYLESRDAAAAIDVLRRAAPGEKIGVIGTSMGGAALVLAEPAIAVDAIVLEQVYPTITEALDNRLRLYLGPVGPIVEPLLTWELEEKLGFTPDALRPVDRIARLHTPMFVIGGDADRHTTLAQTQALFAAAQEPKTLWIVPNAGHVELDRYAGDEYRRRVLAFFAQHIRDETAQSATARSMPSSATSTMTPISSDVTQNGGMK